MKLLSYLYENTIMTLSEISAELGMSRSKVKIFVRDNYEIEYQKERTVRVRAKGLSDADWIYLYENTNMSTNAIESKLGLVKDSIRQKARSRYDKDYRTSREIRVRGWTPDTGDWIPLYENTTLTYQQISELTGLSMKQLDTRIYNKYSEEYRSNRKHITYSRASFERATTIPEEGVHSSEWKR